MHVVESMQSMFDSYSLFSNLFSAFQRIEFPYYFLSRPKCSYYSLFPTSRNMCRAWSRQNLSFWFWSPGLSSIRYWQLPKSVEIVNTSETYSFGVF